MNKRLLKNLDWGILICVALLLIIGLISLYSASESTDFEEFRKQCLWILISIPIMWGVIALEYEVLSRFSYVFYGILIILLIAVLFTRAINRCKKLD